MRKILTKSFSVVFVMTAGVVAGLAAEPTAQACGGCFGPPGPSTQVTAHRMALAISPRRTVLWDQIQYVGNPSSFGWVLPIRGKVDVGVSSDELFERLEQQTQPQVTAPPPPACPEPKKVCRSRCNDSLGAASPSFSDASAGADSSVEVWSTSVVGPYEATQLAATDGTALGNWLKEHGYTIPPEIAPVIEQYIKEGFGFLAIKLVPTASTTRMVPIRIAFDGASPSLPLRMVAAGTGTNVGIKLFMIGEGRWEAKNFANDEVKTSDLVWDFRAMAANLGTLEQSIVSKNAGKVWIAESSDEYGRDGLFKGLPTGTTTLDSGSVFSSAGDETEIERTFAARPSVNVTRLFAQLPSSALATDLELQASSGGKIPAVRQAPKSVGYVCPSTIEVTCEGIMPCGNNPGFPVVGGGNGSEKNGGSENGGSFGCSASSATDGGSSATYSWLGISLASVFAMGTLRRRTNKKGAKNS
ncbi:MAG: hypothetical protein NVS3B20_17440 [Polyangiales bacterium]